MTVNERLREHLLISDRAIAAAIGNEAMTRKRVTEIEARLKALDGKDTEWDKVVLTEAAEVQHD